MQVLALVLVNRSNDSPVLSSLCCLVEIPFRNVSQDLRGWEKICVVALSNTMLLVVKGMVSVLMVMVSAVVVMS